MSQLTIEWQTEDGGEHIAIVNESQGVIIGRHPACDIVLPYRYVSRRHAVIYYATDTFHLQNLSDTNPTLYNDRWSLDTSPLVDLRPGDTFTVGLTRLHISPVKVSEK